METLKELFEETLKDVYFAEKQIIKALPKMARKTKLPELKAAFEEHVEQTKGQVERLDQVFKLLGKKSSGKECPALLGLVEEAEEIMSEAKDPDVLAAGLIGAAQAVEHYEIARYGTLVAWARQLGMTEAVQLLEETLEEEKVTDQKLTQLALSGVNQEAEDEGDDEPKAKSKAAPKAAKAPAKPAAKTAPAKAPAKTPAKTKAASSSSGASRSGSANSNSAKTTAKKK
jgi:ferritin-like metal-binding protein YciE